MSILCTTSLFVNFTSLITSRRSSFIGLEKPQYVAKTTTLFKDRSDLPQTNDETTGPGNNEEALKQSNASGNEFDGLPNVVTKGGTELTSRHERVSMSYGVSPL